MAKGKRAVALFEVIQQDKRFGLKSAEAPPKAANFSAKMAEEAADLWRKKNSDPETWTFPKEKIGKSLGDFGAGVKSAWQAVCVNCSAAMRAGMAWLARIHGVATGAMAAAIVIGGVVLARHFMSPKLGAGSVEAQIEAGPVHPEVLAVTPRGMQLPQETYSGQTSSGGLSPEMQADVAQASRTASETEGANLAQPGERVVNLHYVLMQSYFDEKTAEEARDFLNKNGIACTIERGVKGWRSDFYQVIGLQGFPRASGEAYLAYRQQVEKLGEAFSPHSKYKRFAPEAIKW
jgi:hypothetical protein